MGNTETAIRFEKLQQTRQNRKQPNQKKLPKKEEVALSFVLRMCVGSSDSHFALMTADLDANLVSRYILIPLLLSDCVFVFFYPLFSLSFSSLFYLLTQCFRSICERSQVFVMYRLLLFFFPCRSPDTRRRGCQYMFFHGKVDSLLSIIMACTFDFFLSMVVFLLVSWSIFLLLRHLCMKIHVHLCLIEQYSNTSNLATATSTSIQQGHRYGLLQTCPDR